MKIFLWSFGFLCIVTSSPSFAQPKRTDGPPGSEYGDPNSLEGEFQVGLHFGALLKEGVSEDTSFALGADIDWRPYELFGFRLQALQGLQTPRSTLISLLPMAHTEISNLRPYLVFGPGLGVMNDGEDTKAKFAITGGVGADVMLTDRIGIGMEYLYHSVFDFRDLHYIGARIVIAFPPKF